MIPSGHCSEENQAAHYRVVGEGDEVKPVTVCPARHGHGHGDIMLKSEPRVFKRRAAIITNSRG